MIIISWGQLNFNLCTYYSRPHRKIITIRFTELASPVRGIVATRVKWLSLYVYEFVSGSLCLRYIGRGQTTSAYGAETPSLRNQQRF